jgi:hypothetical protein
MWANFGFGALSARGRPKSVAAAAGPRRLAEP